MDQPMAGAAPAGNAAVQQFRKALGVPEDQPAPEQKVIEACSGKLGPDLKRMAAAVGQMSPSTPGGYTQQPEEAASQNQADPGGKMGASSIFGGGAGGDAGAGAQGDSEDDEYAEDAMPRARAVFGRGGGKR